MKKMAEFRSKFLHELVEHNENFSEEEFRTRIREYLEEGDRATAPVQANCTCPVSQHWYVYALDRPQVTRS